jgi:uncharacterized RDD family membrane protein YckC
MNDPELSLVPLEARPYQGSAAGIATRVAANTVDALVIGAALVGVYAGVAAFRFVVAPRDFRLPDPSLVWFAVCFFELLVVYLTAAWWLSGRTIGDHVMGIRVVTGKRSRLRFAPAFGRALMCAFFPVGLLWCAVSRERRAVHDVVLRTSVVYDWLPRPRPAGDRTAAEPDSDPFVDGDGLHPGGMRT